MRIRGLSPPEDVCIGYQKDGDEDLTRVSCFSADVLSLQQSYVISEPGDYLAFVQTEKQLLTAPFIILDKGAQQ